MTHNVDRVLATNRSIYQVSELFLTELYAKWESMFVITDTLAQKGEDVIITHLNEFFQEILASEEEKKLDLLKRVQDKLRECHDLQSVLNLPLIELDSGKPLSCLLTVLDKKLVEIDVLKNERLQQLQDLREKEAELCNALTADPVIIENIVPSLKDLEAVNVRIFQLEGEKVKRFEKYTKMRKEIVDLLAALEVEVSVLNDWETNLISGEDGSFPLTSESMEQLYETREKYMKEAEANRIAIMELTERLKKLWLRMGVSKQDQDKFMAPLGGIGSSVKACLISEINICQEKRRHMLIPLVSQVRDEISSLCNELTYTEEKINEILMLDDNVTEELLDVLENKCDQLHATLRNCQEILSLAKKRSSLWERAAELELSAHDKNRLFNHRGGQLLKEEKERKAIDINLPKVHQKLVKMLNDYQEKEGSPFLYYGTELLETINAEWETRMGEKENLYGKKKEKVQRKHDAPESAKKRAKVDNDIASSNSAPSLKTSSTRTRHGSKGNPTTINRPIFTPTKFTYEGMPSKPYSRFQEDFAISGGPGIARVQPKNTPRTDRRGTFTVNKLSELPNNS